MLLIVGVPPYNLYLLMYACKQMLQLHLIILHMCNMSMDKLDFRTIFKDKNHYILTRNISKTQGAGLAFVSLANPFQDSRFSFPPCNKSENSGIMKK